MIVKRDVQHITSPFGKRQGFLKKHMGVDLRSWDDSFKFRLPVVLPEVCIFDRKVYQSDWGWTYVFEPTESGYYELKFIHLTENNFLIPERVYEKDYVIGYTTLTPYMKKHGYGEHVHFETLKGPGVWDNPVNYMEKMGINYE